jgi:hypothetical protein
VYYVCVLVCPYLLNSSIYVYTVLELPPIFHYHTHSYHTFLVHVSNNVRDISINISCVTLCQSPSIGVDGFECYPFLVLFYLSQYKSQFLYSNHVLYVLVFVLVCILL